MENIKRIAVLYGGSSSEREISLLSGQGIYSALCDIGYQCQLIDYKNLKDLIELKNYDFVFIALHGFEGEGGKLQKELDDLNILYSGSKSEACRNTWNKGLTKKSGHVFNLSYNEFQKGFSEKVKLCCKKFNIDDKTCAVIEKVVLATIKDFSEKKFRL